MLDAANKITSQTRKIKRAKTLTQEQFIVDD